MKYVFNIVLFMSGLTVIASALGGVRSISPVPKVFTNSVGIKLIRIEPGSFTMGETNPTPKSFTGKGLGPRYTERGDWDESPVHGVTISKPFYISETPITIEQYKKFKKEYAGLDLFEPYVSGVSWNDAVAFCRWLSKKEGKEYRLPTEAEWEYAARAGTKTLFWSGNEPRKEDGPNAWGLKDIAYGVPEWCFDWHGRYPEEDQVDPVGPASGTTRVVRDGGYLMQYWKPKYDSGYGLDLRPKDDKTDLGFKDSGFKNVPSFYRRSANRSSMIPDVPSPENNGPATRYMHYIGFRLVQAALPATRPLRVEQPFPLDCVLESDVAVEKGPNPSKPYFKARPMLPMPPENDQGGGVDAVGLHPGIGAHNHSGGIEVAPNGDLLHFSFSGSASDTEADSNSAMIVSRLRHGAEQWDMPDLFYDIADLFDREALIWNDNGKLWFFGGGYYFGDVRFRYTTSSDSGATWSKLSLPYVIEEKGFIAESPINSAFRGPNGTIYFGSDAKNGTSMMWASPDDGKSWYDTGGRTAGMHTNFVLLKDGRILGMGSRTTDIEGYMPKTYSSDWGRTWSKPVKTEFPALKGNQRPVILRLKSGRLFFASDFQMVQMKKNPPPATIKDRGSFVALSADEGETWHIKKLELAMPHESRQIRNIKRPGFTADHDYSTIGYSDATQEPNGVIHLMTSMNHPSQHFEMNEAWILSDEPGEVNHKWEGSRAQGQKHEGRYPNGKIKVIWSSRTGANGDYILHGIETWYYADGKKKYEVVYQDGRKIGQESFWLPGGVLKWRWDHRPDDTGTWTHYWPNGQKKIQSTWRGFKAEGGATRWDQRGKMIRQVTFKDGAIVG